MKDKLKALLICLLAIPILIFVQTLAMIIGAAPQGVPDYVYYIINSICYIALTWLALKFLLKKIYGYTMSDVRFGKFQIRWHWIVVGILLVAVVFGLFFLIPGQMQENTNASQHVVYTILSGVLRGALAAAVVEEMLFRGACMGVLEKNFGKAVAVLIPSLMFGAAHLMNGQISTFSAIQLLVSGTLAGAMFCLIAMQGGSLWNSIFVHFVWNASQTFIVFAPALDEDAFFTYVLNSGNQFLIGGEYGIECSLFANLAYVVVIVLAIVLMKNKKSANKTGSHAA